MLCQTGSKGFGQKEMLIDYVETGGPGANEYRGARARALTGRGFCQPIPDNHVLMRLCPVIGTHSTSSVVRDGHALRWQENYI